MEEAMDGLYDRFIPTCVGNTSSGSGPKTPISVHPHVRGEYEQHLDDALQPAGSSPRAWGIPVGRM